MKRQIKTKQEVIDYLKEFNEEALEVLNLSFKSKLKNKGFRLNWSKETKELKSEIRCPDEESIKAYCNDLRKFIQKNDSLEVKKLCKVYNLSFFDSNERKMLAKEIREVNKFLKRKSSFSINGKNFTTKEILDIFLYGKYSHRTLKNAYESIRKNPFMFAPMKNEFINILTFYLFHLNNIIYLNSQVLKKIK